MGVYKMAKKNPAAAISQNQNGREVIEEPDVLPPPEEELPEEEPVAVEPEEPGEVGVRDWTVVTTVSVTIEEDMSEAADVIDEVDSGLSEVGNVKGEEVRAMLGVEDVDNNVTGEETSLVEAGLEGEPVEEELDDESAELEADVELEMGVDADDDDEPEVADG